jgi:hypothetical protein
MASTSTMTITDFYAGTRSFDATFEVDCAGKNVNPGVSARIEVRGSNMDQVLSLPRQALFTKEGKSIVYIKRPPADWEACPVQIKYLTESRAAIEGLTEGTEVAMLDPNSQKAKAGRKAGALTSIIGGAIR